MPRICGKYAAYMWHYGNMWRKWHVRVCLRWTKGAEMLRNAIAYAEICDYMRIFANLCINKYSKFWKCHYMQENMRYTHFCKICGICCDRMIAINRYPYTTRATPFKTGSHPSSQTSPRTVLHLAPPGAHNRVSAYSPSGNGKEFQLIRNPQKNSDCQ